MTTAGMTTAPGLPQRSTLADYLIPSGLAQRASAWQRDLALILGGVGLLVLGGYVSVTVPAIQFGQVFVPINEFVPLTLQTFAVLFTGALLGARRGISATGLYLLIGIVGFPVFSADSAGVHRSGLETFFGVDGGQVVFGSTGGYLLGFLFASAIVGGLAQRGWDRHIGGSIGAMLIGTAIIYAFGVTWLAVAANLDIGRALTFGLWPFLPGDIIKLVVAAGLLPLGWKLVARRASEAPGGHPKSS
jgi:biotin transport system substrate-specific component